MAISLGKHLTINIETGFWILVHLLDGLGDLSSMWVLFDINQLFINYWDDHNHESWPVLLKADYRCGPKFCHMHMVDGLAAYSGAKVENIKII